MRRSLPTAAASLAVLAALTACSGSEGGTATPQTTTASSTTQSTPTKPSSTRPREVRLDGKKPCDLMTPEQLAQIGETTAPRPSTSNTFKSPICDFSANGAFWAITTVLSQGIEMWTGGELTGRPTEIPPIAGFPAITVTVPDETDRCDVAVDVADGQHMHVSFQVLPGSETEFPKPCDGARQVAEAAMQNLTK